MRLVVQRVSRAAVRVGEQMIGAIGPGAVVLVGIGAGDAPELVDRMADKLLGLRYFEDEAGRTNRSIAEAAGAFLVVSQFTLYADLRRGRRRGSPKRHHPSWPRRWSSASPHGCARPGPRSRPAASGRRWPWSW